MAGDSHRPPLPASACRPTSCSGRGQRPADRLLFCRLRNAPGPAVLWLARSSRRPIIPVPTTDCRSPPGQRADHFVQIGPVAKPDGGLCDGHGTGPRGGCRGKLPPVAIACRSRKVAPWIPYTLTIGEETTGWRRSRAASTSSSQIVYRVAEGGARVPRLFARCALPRASPNRRSHLREFLFRSRTGRAQAPASPTRSIARAGSTPTGAAMPPPPFGAAPWSLPTAIAIRALLVLTVHAGAESRSAICDSRAMSFHKSVADPRCRPHHNPAVALSICASVVR